MWRMHTGDRVLTEAEWAVFAAGLDLLWDEVEQDISDGTDDSDTGVGAFDRLTPEQKLALLAAVATAVRDPAVPCPRHTAANEGAVAAVFRTVQDLLADELDPGPPGGDDTTELRRMLLAAAGDPDGREEPLPAATSTDPEPWGWLLEEVEDRVLWDADHEMGDLFLDLPPGEARERLGMAGIDPDYYLESPPEPGDRGLVAARRALARLLGRPEPGDDGLYPALLDRYSDLVVGPVSDDEAAAWDGHPWVELIRQTEPEWDCDYPMWTERFGGALPAEPFVVAPATPGTVDDLPAGVRLEPSGAGWVVRDEAGAYWCGLVENGWADDPDEAVPALTFPTEADARAAYAQADRLYDERAARHDRALDLIGATGR